MAIGDCSPCSAAADSAAALLMLGGTVMPSRQRVVSMNLPQRSRRVGGQAKRTSVLRQLWPPALAAAPVIAAHMISSRSWSHT